jgi:hypothetical protein
MTTVRSVRVSDADILVAPARKHEADTRDGQPPALTMSAVPAPSCRSISARYAGIGEFQPEFSAFCHNRRWRNSWDICLGDGTF